MTTSWIVYSLLVGALLSFAARWLENVCRLAARPARWIWAGGIALTLALAAVAPHRAAPDEPQLLLTKQTFVRTAGPAAVVRQTSVVATVQQAARSLETWTRRALARAEHAVPASVERSLGTLWMIASAVLVLLFGAVYLRFRNARRRWPLAELQGERVRIAPDAGPAVVGLSQPEIVVPRWLLERSPEEQRLVLVHEREHVIARDPLLLAAACAAAALMPWNPAIWWMLSRLHLAVEVDCDERVLRRGVARRSYGALLIDLAGRCSGLPIGAPALADRSSHLERRLDAMLPTRSRRSPARTAMFGVLATLALLAACEAKMPTNAEVADMDAKQAAAVANHFAFIRVGDSNTVYMVDGRTVGAAEAQAIAPNEIARIEVQKKNIDGVVSSQLNVRTRAAEGLPPLAPADSNKRVELLMRHDVGGLKADTTVTHTFEIRARDGVSEDGAPMKKFNGVILIDGVRVDASRMATLSPADIVSMEVIKGPAATKLYDAPEAINGVIKITTKAGKK